MVPRLINSERPNRLSFRFLPSDELFFKLCDHPITFFPFFYNIKCQLLSAKFCVQITCITHGMIIKIEHLYLYFV